MQLVASQRGAGTRTKRKRFPKKISQDRDLRQKVNLFDSADRVFFAVYCCVLQRVAVCRSALQCVAECCGVVQFVAVCCQCVAGVLRCVAVCCSVLPVCCQCVAVCCSVL